MTTYPETWTSFADSYLDGWRSSSSEKKESYRAGLKPDALALFDTRFKFFSLPHQLPPDLAPNGEPWTTWLLLGGRGAGKTRAGAEWARAAAHVHARIALVGETEHDAREVMVEGVSGLLRIHAWDERPKWIPSRRRLEWRNGAVAQIFSAEDPESLRGPQFTAAWLDELAKWRHADATFDMLQFGLRLGERPRQVITTTPRPIPLIKRLIADPRTAVTRAPTAANAANLSPAFLDTVVARYAGTRLGRQELDGEIIEERADALWSRGLIEINRVAAAPPLQRIVVAIDPPVSATKRSDACGLVAAGRAEAGTIYVIADETVRGLSPAGWAAKAVALWRRLEADALVAELSLIECPAFSLTLLHSLWSGFETGINGFASLSGLLIAYFGARFGVLGVYVTGRTREKQTAATGEAMPSIVSEVVKAVTRRR